MENWKPIKNYEGRYEISNKGNVRSLLNNQKRPREIPKILTPVKIGHKPKNLYYAVNLYNENGVDQFTIHRLVACHFIENLSNLPLVNHKDENTFNNNVENLEWCTHQYNQEYSLSQITYRFISPNGELIEIINLRKYSREHKLNHAHMYQVAKGNLKSYKGFIKA